MPTLANYRKSIEEIENGQWPSTSHDREAAVKALVDEICIRPWETPEEREQAQGLVARLYRLEKRSPGRPTRPRGEGECRVARQAPQFSERERVEERPSATAARSRN
jgi:hypothetical protein